MSDSYLWDRAGPPDAEVERLERLLAPLRCPRSTPRLAMRSRWWTRTRPIGLAAAIVLAAVGAWTWSYATAPRVRVTRLAGTARIGGDAMGAAQRAGADQWIETDAAGAVRLSLEQIGALDVGAQSRIALRGRTDDEWRFELARGSVDAHVQAPPRQLVLVTPAGVLTDLGCRFHVSVADDGTTTVDVAEGQVEFAHAGRIAFIPDAWRCVARPSSGPDAPTARDAPAAFVAALQRLRFDVVDVDALHEVLAAAGPGDALTLWHVLRWTPAEARERVYRRMLELIEPPRDIDPQAVLRLEAPVLDCWRKHLVHKLQ